MTPVVITGQVGGHFRSSKPRAPKLRSGIIARGCRNGEELVQILEGRLREEGLNVRLDAEATQVDRLPVGKRVTLHVSGKDDTFVAGELLLATGRRPTWRAGIGTAGGEIMRAGMRPKSAWSLLHLRLRR